MVPVNIYYRDTNGTSGVLLEADNRWGSIWVFPVFNAASKLGALYVFSPLSLYDRFSLWFRPRWRQVALSLTHTGFCTILSNNRSSDHPKVKKNTGLGNVAASLSHLSKKNGIHPELNIDGTVRNRKVVDDQRFHVKQAFNKCIGIHTAYIVLVCTATVDVAVSTMLKKKTKSAHVCPAFTC